MEKTLFHKIYTLYGCIPEIGEIYRFINKKAKKMNGSADYGNYTKICLSLKEMENSVMLIVLYGSVLMVIFLINMKLII